MRFNQVLSHKQRIREFNIRTFIKFYPNTRTHTLKHEQENVTNAIALASLAICWTE